MSLEVTMPAPEGDRHPSETSAATTQADRDRDILSAADVYLVLLTNRCDRRIRRPFLSLHSAQAALKRARDNGLECHLILCRLEPITVNPDLDLDGEVAG